MRMAVSLEEWPQPWWWSVYARYPKIPLSYRKKRLCLHLRTTPLSIYICTYCPQVTQRCYDLTGNTGRSITMMLLGNIALVLKGLSYQFLMSLVTFHLTQMAPVGCADPCLLCLSHPWFWASLKLCILGLGNWDLCWSDRLWCCLFLWRAASKMWCTGPERTTFRSEIRFLINWRYLPFDPWYPVVT